MESIAYRRLSIALLLLGAPLFAQPRPQSPKSREILPDNSVTFQFSPPAATTVGLNGDWAIGKTVASGYQTSVNNLGTPKQQTALA
jgi:hypothetical protein